MYEGALGLLMASWLLFYLVRYPSLMVLYFISLFLAGVRVYVHYIL